jgi:hypothetical protein
MVRTVVDGGFPEAVLVAQRHAKNVNFPFSISVPR